VQTFQTAKGDQASGEKEQCWSISRHFLEKTKKLLHPKIKQP
jgi:hypothetical protein